MTFRRIKYKSEADFVKLRESAKVVAITLAEVAKYVKPGVPLTYLDSIGEQCIRDHHAIPSFKGFEGYPASLCLSVNDVVVHGIPKPNDVLRDGDIVSVDCGALLNGFHGDFAYTFAVGEVKEEVRLLMERTKESLMLGIKAAVSGNTVGDIGHAVQSYCEQFNYGVVRELCGHGIGRDMHERPDIPNYGRPHTGDRLQPGMCICIEPMITLGTHKIYMEKDGWTIHTQDNKPAAHYEHQMIITDKGTEVISSYKLIGEVLGTQELY
ncbi:MAG: type I methionyl aminopeptidase [Bacteroidales bacterium]|nr:type I methionyl aminopeptidase [Bacteroidales bacterium]MBO7647548.1 type I methionyl aminopeptidase [Bacteroidales bacterium]